MEDQLLQNIQELRINYPRQAGSNSSLYSDIVTKKSEKFLNAKNVKNNKRSTCF